MSTDNLAKGNECPNEKPMQPNNLPSKKGEGGFARMHLNKPAEHINSMAPFAAGVLTQGSQVKNKVYIPSSAFRTEDLVTVKQANERLSKEELKAWKKSIDTNKAAHIRKLREGTKSKMHNRQYQGYLDGFVEGLSDEELLELHQQTFRAVRDLVPKDIRNREKMHQPRLDRMESLARGDAVEVQLGENRSETIQIRWPDNLPFPVRMAMLQDMWENRELLMNVYDAATLSDLYDRNAERLIHLVYRFDEEDPHAQGSMTDFIIEVANSEKPPEGFRERLQYQEIVGQQIIAFGPGVAIPLRGARKIHGEALSGEAEIARIHENLSKLSETQLALVGDLVARGYEAIILAMLSTQPLKIGGGAPLSGMIEGLTVFLGPTKVFVRAEQTNREIPIRITEPPATGFDFARAESIEGGKAYYLTQWSREMHQRLLALLARVNVGDAEYMTERAARRFKHILDVIFEGSSSIAEQENRTDALGLTINGVLSFSRATWLGMYLGYLENTGDIAVITYKDLLQATQQWDKEGKLTFPSAGEILAERKDDIERGEHTA